MAEVPRLTVAVPTCNGSRHLREALAGLRAQGEVAFDVLVSDDRSEDDTVAIARDEMGDRAEIVVNPERLGLAGNWNRCVERSRTDWVAIFHQDDVMRPGPLAEHLGLIEEMADSSPALNAGLIAGDAEMIDESGRPIARGESLPGDLTPGRAWTSSINYRPGWTSLVAASNPFRCSAVTTRKAAHAAVGGFDPSYRYAVDWDFWARISAGWGLVWSFRPPSVAMRWHSASETHRFKTGTTDLDEQIGLLDALHRRGDFPKSERDKADRRLARAFLNRAHVALKGGDVELARSCLARTIRLSPRMLGRIVADPRLAAQMGLLSIAPKLAGRWFGRPDPP